MPTPLLLRARSVAAGAAVLAVGLGACGGSPSPEPTPAPSSAAVPPPRRPPTMLVTPAIAGEAIAVVPLTLVVWEQGIEGLAELGDRARVLAWADSSVGVALQLRAPEVKWILPPELRKIARRASGVAPDPDRMGQAVMRAENLKDVPDPLRGHLRSLAALTGGRFALVPASLGFLKDPSGGMRAELSLVLADTRTGKVAWRSLAWGVGATPARALAAALASVLPADLGAAR